MRVDDFRNNVLTGKWHSNLIATKDTGTQPNQVNPNDEKFGGNVPEVFFLVPIALLMVWAIVNFRISQAWKITQSKQVSTQNLHQVPCKRCHFFTNNPYLKCAVHPETALTPEAAECPDFCAKNKRSESEKNQDW